MALLGGKVGDNEDDQADAGQCGTDVRQHGQYEGSKGLSRSEVLGS